VVEPYLSKQWFVSVKPLAEKAIAAVKEGRIRLHPKSWENTFYDWMYNIRDWCISRQIWWGHRIPAWTCAACGGTVVSRDDPEACPECGGRELARETDVLDTWFSSALWPFSTLGWPDETRELGFFYPTSVLITSFDILFFWVARMMMMGIHFMGEVPFRDVYLHALVRDKHGQKMSKSKGNVMDPLLLMDKYGTDALRFTLTAFAAQGRDIKLSEERIEGYRHFINKVWNAARFALLHLDEEAVAAETAGGLALPHRWILSRANRAVAAFRAGLDGFRFNDSAAAVYGFIWHELCDWYLEWIKPDLYGDDGEAKKTARAVLARVLETALKLLHPIAPFVTEEIWAALPGERNSIMTEPFPEADPAADDPEAEEEAGLVMGVVTAIRAIRSDMLIHPNQEVPVIVVCPEAEKRRTIEDAVPTIAKLCRAGSISIGIGGDRPRGAAAGGFADVEVFVPMEGLIDVEKEKAKLKKEREKLEKEIRKTGAKLENENFLARAPEEIVDKERGKLSEATARMAKIEEHLRQLAELG
jgi:valyl-tRNA synthetase